MVQILPNHMYVGLILHGTLWVSDTATQPWHSMRVRVRSSGLPEGKGQGKQNVGLDQTKTWIFVSCLQDLFSIPEQLAKFGEFGDSLSGQIADWNHVWTKIVINIGILIDAFNLAALIAGTPSFIFHPNLASSRMQITRCQAESEVRMFCSSQVHTYIIPLGGAIKLE